ncbi:MAG: IPT/TIG domain-containing protein [Chitinophagaceae bacterium]|nr:IPT/TIG domain-containing protein [Chitinophagaceae bacterium]MBN8668275.1 IPT/TIG domain-containing protein [Chitinophagales bacterium]
MKKYFQNLLSFGLFLLFSTLVITGCEKDKDGSPEVDTGSMSSGELNPGSAAGGQVVTLTGSGIGQIRSIVFDKNNVPAPFTSTLNTASDLIFRVPDTAYGGPQNVIFTNADGKTLSVPFSVIALPNVTSAFPTDFQAGSEITLTGNNLDDVTEVLLEGTTDACTIVSQSRRQMVISMPVSTADRAKLKITNSSGNRITDMEFVNVDRALSVFREQLDNGFENWGWGGTFAASPEDKITGTNGLKAAYDPGGAWGGMQLGNGGSIDVSGYKYFAFWAKGADVDKNVQFYLNWSNVKVITIPANKWTYFKYELATNYAGINPINNVTFQIFDAGKTIFFDNIIFFK